MTQFSHFPYPNQYLILPGTTTVITQDTTIYIGPNGSDTTGNGSETNPYATLAKAWSVATTVVIRGDAILYITFLKGKYLCSPNSFFPETMYHPQGNNIIIQGDPRSLTQHYLFSVDEYNWDMARFVTHGHTGTVQLWTRGTTLSTGDNNAFTQRYTGYGTTAHGYTGDGISRTDDVGSFVSISNPWLSAPQYYNDYQNYILGYRYLSHYSHRSTYTAALNAASPSVNRSNSECTHDAYAGLWYGHQPAYTSVAKHGNHMGILGLARVRKITDAGKLGLDFINMNLDMRAGTFHDSGSGGIRDVQSTDSLHAITGNLPANKLYDPVGYYGATYAGGTPSNNGRDPVDYMAYTYGLDNNSSTPNDSIFPSITQSGASRQVTDEALLVTNYTATLICTGDYRVRTPINLVGCSLRALRNLCFVQAGFAGGTGSTNLNNMPPTDNASGTGVLVGAAFSGGVGGVQMTNATPCISLMDSSLGIRHIGIYGFGGHIGNSAITLTRSKLTAYSDFEWYPKSSEKYASIVGGDVIAAERAHNNHPNTHARLRSLNNTPVLNAFSSGPVIFAEKSVVDFAMTPAALDCWNTGFYGRGSNAYRLCDESVIMRSGSGYVVSANQSDIRLTSAIMTNDVQFPGHRLFFFLPYWNGMTLQFGATTGVYSPMNSGWGNTLPSADIHGSSVNKFANVVGYIKRPTSSGRGETFCRVSYRGFNGAVEYTYYDATFSNSGVSGSTFYFNGSEVQGPSFGHPSANGAGWRMLSFCTIPVGTYKLYNTLDLLSELSRGNTLEFHAYRDNAEQAGYSGSILISDKYIALHTPGGTYEVKSRGGTGANVGRSSVHSVYDPDDFKNSPSAFPFAAFASGCIELMNQSTLSYEKNLVLYGGANAVCARNSSTLYSQQRSDAGVGYNPSTYLLMGGQVHRGIWALNGSVVKVGNVYSKNPPIVPSGQSFNSGGEFNQLRAERNSRIQVAGDCVLVSPTRTAKDCWVKSRPNWSVDVRVNWGGGVAGGDVVTSSKNAYINTASVYANRGSDIVLVTDLENGSRAIFASDGSVYPSGGAPSEFQDANALFIRANEQSRVRVPKATSTAANPITNGVTQLTTDFAVLGWSGGVEYKIQRCQGVTANRFTDQTSTDPMWRFWNRPMGTIAGSTAFVLFPVRVVSTDTPLYGQSDTIAVDGQRMDGTTVLNSYGKYMIEPIMGAAAGLSYAFTNPPSEGGGIFRAEF